MKRFIFTALLAAAFCVTGMGQETDCPVIGAQVFIEPGQSLEYIEHCFDVMDEAGMEVARIRMMGTHLMGENARTDLYDYAWKTFYKDESQELKMFRLFCNVAMREMEEGTYRPRDRRLVNRSFGKAVVRNIKTK